MKSEKRKSKQILFLKKYEIKYYKKQVSKNEYGKK